MGGIARRGAMSAVRRIMGVVGSRAASPTVADRATSRPGVQQPSVQRASSVRIFRQAPELGSSYRSLSSRQAPAHEFGSSERRAIEPASASSASTVGGRKDAQLARMKEQSGSPTGATISAAPNVPVTGVGKRRTLSVGLGSTGAEVQSGSSTSGTSSSAESKRVRRAKKETRPASHSRLEPRIRAHSASLRDGPPKVVRDRRKPASSATRRFREYSSVTKDGVTLMVPTRR